MKRIYFAAPLFNEMELKRNEEILNLKMQHSLKLKQEIGSFVDENPQIAAKLIQNWLLTGGGNDGRNRGK